MPELGFPILNLAILGSVVVWAVTQLREVSKAR